MLFKRYSITNILILTFIIIINLIISSCNRSKDPISSGTDPGLQNDGLITYIPLHVGNNWTYRAISNVSNGYGFETRISGIEKWQIDSITQNGNEFRMKCEFNGTRKSYLYGVLQNSISFNNVTNYLDIILYPGPYYSTKKSLSMVLKGYVGSNFMILKDLLERKFINNYRFLEVSFPAKSDSILSISHGPIWIDSYHHTINYIIQKDLGIKSAKLSMYSEGVASISFDLLDHQLY